MIDFFALVALGSVPYIMILYFRVGTCNLDYFVPSLAICLSSSKTLSHHSRQGFLASWQFLCRLGSCLSGVVSV